LPPAQAKAAVQELAAQNPKDAAAQVAVGQFLFQVGDTAGAAASFQQALSIDPSSPEPYLGLATVAFRNGDNAAAETELQRMVKQRPDDERGYLSLAMLAVRQGKAPQAEQHLRQAISAIPEAQNSRLALAQLAAARKDAALVKAMLSQTITLAQNKLPVLLRAAMLEASMQDYPAALAHVDAFRKAGGSEAQAEEVRGTLLLAQKRLPEALTALEKSFKARPSGGVALKLFTARRESRTPQPERVLVDWVREHPGDLQVRLGLANYLLAEKDYPAAIQNYEAIARTASNPALLNNLAWAYQQVGDRRAVATAKAAYEGSKQSPDIADTYGWILLRNGKAAEALPVL
jgi:tetratricopeptide (TPR) repeat protein